MLETLFAFGTIPFWILMAIEFVLLLTWIEYEAAGWATFSILAVLGLLQLSGHGIYQYIVANPAIVLYGIGAYFVIGTVWSICRWYFYVKKQRYLYDEFKNEFLQEWDITGSKIPDELKQKFKDSLHSSYGYYNDEKFELFPKVNYHKAQIYLWMVYWPWSCCWTIINDPVKRLFREIYSQIKGFLQRISDRIWAGTEDDFKIPGKKD